MAYERYWRRARELATARHVGTVETLMADVERWRESWTWPNPQGVLLPGIEDMPPELAERVRRAGIELLPRLVYWPDRLTLGVEPRRYEGMANDEEEKEQVSEPR